MRTKHFLRNHFKCFAIIEVIRAIVEIIPFKLHNIECPNSLLNKYLNQTDRKINRDHDSAMLINCIILTDFKPFHVEEDLGVLLSLQLGALNEFKQEKKLLSKEERQAFVKEKNNSWDEIAIVQKKILAYLKKYDYV
jgi:hypothetical protein